uniref:Uncharacterized protein n=1 Tax=Zea mays TaxID=4577 RepID=A0A804P1L9_MAIZE
MWCEDERVVAHGRPKRSRRAWLAAARRALNARGEGACCCGVQLAAQVGGGARYATRERGSSSDVRQQSKGGARCRGLLAMVVELAAGGTFGQGKKWGELCWNFWAPWRKSGGAAPGTGSWAPWGIWGCYTGRAKLG